MPNETRTKGSLKTEDALLLERLRGSGEVPRHVAVIMDGNGRWASDRGLPRWEGHRAGMQAVREVIEGSVQAGIQHLTLYAFSRENWERPQVEVEALMELLHEYVEREKEELCEAGVRVQVFGELDRLPPSVREAIDQLEHATEAGDVLQLHLAISYGSRSEIVRAARHLARQCVAGTLVPEEVDTAHFSAALYTARWPDPDLLIRTSGEHRVSNFLLWQIAYAEMYVTPILWPDFSRRHLFEALLDYQHRDRRFGRVRA
ncbi:MAG: isoprenyl transferase [Gemmatimonadota bacterium]